MLWSQHWSTFFIRRNRFFVDAMFCAIFADGFKTDFHLTSCNFELLMYSSWLYYFLILEWLSFNSFRLKTLLPNTKYKVFKQNTSSYD